MINAKKSLNEFYADLMEAERHAYNPMEWNISNLMKEEESEAYGACTFEIRNRRIKFRIAKITPTKNGQFVTFWKRIGNGPIVPLDVDDLFDLLVISVRKADLLGQFVFPKALLLEQGILSKEGEGGKLAMRVYPPWDVTTSKQAKRTQDWQSNYFFDVRPKENLNSSHLQKLFFQASINS